MRERASANSRTRLCDLQPLFLLRREQVPTRVELLKWVSQHLELTPDPYRQEVIGHMDHMLTNRGAVRIFARTQLAELDGGDRPSFSLGLGPYTITYV